MCMVCVWCGVCVVISVCVSQAIFCYKASQFVFILFPKHEIMLLTSAIMSGGHS